MCVVVILFQYILEFDLDDNPAELSSADVTHFRAVIVDALVLIV